ncbi:hypothetical protein HRbin40_02452 [bacterium HR40]|nr:hypothetical protein HRbin40_02452 [bacterium HR40]
MDSLARGVLAAASVAAQLFGRSEADCRPVCHDARHLGGRDRTVRRGLAYVAPG